MVNSGVLIGTTQSLSPLMRFSHTPRRYNGVGIHFIVSQKRPFHCIQKDEIGKTEWQQVRIT
jgi:hypothetical protein